jgi:hypothetical protein
MEPEAAATAAFRRLAAQGSMRTRIDTLEKLPSKRDLILALPGEPYHDRRRGQRPMKIIKTPMMLKRLAQNPLAIAPVKTRLNIVGARSCGPKSLAGLPTTSHTPL